jgi:uncharacterized protein YyaL (SSP411 family)
MRTRELPRFFAIALLTACGAAPHAGTTPVAPPAWVSLEEGLGIASREHRPLLLSIQADWCHWCHVMNDTTYRDPEVLALLADRFVVAREEADARPDLAERYAEYGWPATILFAPDGTEVLALRGHRSSEALLPLLRAVLSDLDEGRAPGTSLPRRAAPRTGEAVALETLRHALTVQLDDLYDEAMGGWGSPQKYPFEAPVEHTFLRARLGERELRDRAVFTLEREAELIDPVWGGMYQYSEEGDWAHPHYERIASVQAGAIEGFALAARATGDDAWRLRAVDVVRYVRAFLTREDGAFFASQDADLRAPDGGAMSGAEYASLDDAGRRARGIPRIDERAFATTNGALITALARLSEVLPALGTLDDATRAADVVIASLRDEHGLFLHEASSGHQRFLADQIAMARALFAIEQAGGPLRYRTLARETLDATLVAFGADGGALVASTSLPSEVGTLAVSRVPPIENALAATLLFSLARLADDAEETASPDDARALAILSALADPAALAPLGRKVGEILLALEAAHHGVARFSLVGEPGDPRTVALHRAMLASDEPLRAIERSAPGEGRYPFTGEPAVYVCALDRCSFPLSDPSTFAHDVSHFLAR